MSRVWGSDLVRSSDVQLEMCKLFDYVMICLPVVKGQLPHQTRADGGVSRQMDTSLIIYG